MPESIARRYMVLDTWDLTGDRLSLRFLPEEFRAEQEDPVLRAEVALPAETGEAERMASEIEAALVVDIEVEETALTVWIEERDQPVRFPGTVTWRHEDYAVPDYVRALEARDLAWSREHEEAVRLNQTINRALGFLDRTIDRIEKKQDLLHPDDDRYLKQVQLLRSVRRQLRDD